MSGYALGLVDPPQTFERYEHLGARKISVMAPTKGQRLKAYRTNLRDLRTTHPLLASSLEAAEKQRAQRLQVLLSGMRLAGLERLYAYLDAAGAAFDEAPRPAGDQHPDIRKIAFLVRRVRTDFETGLESALSGYPLVTSDAMRDVMEIEALLLDFAAIPPHIDEWLQADRRTLIGKFGPGNVRKRLKSAGIEPWSSPGFVAIDYQAHSESLHVSPHANPFTAIRGVARGKFSIFDDVPFIEMFEHGSRVIFAIEMLRVMAYRLEERDSEYKPFIDLTSFRDAHERTAEMQFIVLAFIRAPAEVEKKQGRPGTPAEHLRFVADELERYRGRRPHNA